MNDIDALWTKLECGILEALSSTEHRYAENWAMATYSKLASITAILREHVGSGWISCKKEMPEADSGKSIDVLATFYDRSGQKHYKRFVNVWLDSRDGFVMRYDVGGKIHGVTHWMYPPQQPQAEGE